MYKRQVPGGATVDAVEVDGAGAVQAAANAASSPWSHAVRVYRCGIGIFRPGVSEPLWGGRDAASVSDGGEETAAGDCSEEGESATVPPELLYHHIVSNPPWFVDSLQMCIRDRYECNPIAFIAEQAGGLAFSEEGRILDLQPEAIHQRVTFYAGAHDMVMKVKEFLNFFNNI